VAQNPKEERKQLQKWLKEEWIHPALTAKRQKYKGYILPLTVNKNMLRNNINITN
jgi:hypothetical protein